MLTGVILAAGEGERMGELKQLLPWNKENTILGSSIDNLLAAKIVDEKLIIVLGAESARIRKYLENKYLQLIEEGSLLIIVNEEYQKGMMSSVKKALEAIGRESRYLLFTLGDKPFISAKSYQRLYKAALRKKADIFVPKYKTKKGHPVFLKRTLVNKAFSLNGKGGLKNLMEIMPHRVYYYPFSSREITIDLDYKRDYLKYKNNDFGLT